MTAVLFLTACNSDEGGESKKKYNEARGLTVDGGAFKSATPTPTPPPPAAAE